jgi:hypothetical protein
MNLLLTLLQLKLLHLIIDVIIIYLVTTYESILSIDFTAVGIFAVFVATIDITILFKFKNKNLGFKSYW